ncbi:MAG: SGNH/GDSL hydrolase family protein [Treponema sp.]|nr:SGNH/GDSL hydrolase family protein [Treponema sp.]
MKDYSVNDIPQLHILGRTGSCKQKKMLPLFWTGSGIECRLKSGSLWVELESSYSIYEPWVSVRLNGSQVARFIVERGRRWYCLYQNVSSEKERTVQLLKDTQPMPDDPDHVLILHALRVTDNAEFLPVAAKKLVMEFVGDSITTGEGLAGTPDEMEWLPSWMTTHHNYACLTAQELDADFRIVSQSGWGIVTGWDNNIHNNIPAYYRQVCGVVPGGYYERLGARNLYDFSVSPADVVVINLGTNDEVAFSQNAWIDPSDGRAYKMSLDETGQPCSSDTEKITVGVKSFLHTVHESNPNAYLFWCFGMCDVPLLSPCIRRSVSEYKQEDNNSRVSVVELPSMSLEKENEHGSRCHPGPVTHLRAAQRIVEAVKSVL